MGFGRSERGDGTMSEIFLGKIFRYPKMTPQKKMIPQNQFKNFWKIYPNTTIGMIMKIVG